MTFFAVEQTKGDAFHSKSVPLARFCGTRPCRLPREKPRVTRSATKLPEGDVPHRVFVPLTSPRDSQISNQTGLCEAYSAFAVLNRRLTTSMVRRHRALGRASFRYKKPTRSCASGVASGVKRTPSMGMSGSRTATW